MELMRLRSSALEVAIDGRAASFEFAADMTDPDSVLPVPSVRTLIVEVQIDSTGVARTRDLGAPTRPLRPADWRWEPDPGGVDGALRFVVRLPLQGGPSCTR